MVQQGCSGSSPVSFLLGKASTLWKAGLTTTFTEGEMGYAFMAGSLEGTVEGSACTECLGVIFGGVMFPGLLSGFLAQFV